MNLLSGKGIQKNYTGRMLFDGVDFGIEEGDKIGIVGINGTGKSTLLRICAVFAAKSNLSRRDEHL